jgi:ABC-type sugar transport system substrate-binding protein
MIGLAFDENFNHDVIRGLLRRNPRLDTVRLQAAGMARAEDPAVLEWAAQQDRVLISHDVSTLTAHAYARVAAGKAMPGVFEVPRNVAIATAIEDLLLIAECSRPGEWEGQVRYLPLR